MAGEVAEVVLVLEEWGSYCDDGRPPTTTVEKTSAPKPHFDHHDLLLGHRRAEARRWWRWHVLESWHCR